VLDYAITHKLGNIISNSYGLPEAEAGPADAQMFNTVIKKAAAQGIAVNVATGDSGDFYLGTPVGAASILADSPFATGVGGTSINVPTDKSTVDSAWGFTETALGWQGFGYEVPQVYGFREGGGGGESSVLAKPAYQKGLPGTGRQLPDVSALADPQTGAIVVAPDPNNNNISGFSVIGGTSLATPIFSAIWALADQAAGKSLGQAAPIIAKLSSAAITDIVPIVVNNAQNNTSGTVTSTDNGVQTVTNYDPAQLLGLGTTQPAGFLGTLLEVPVTYFHANPRLWFFDIGFGTDSSLRATTGWDNATGWGVPNGLNFINEAKKAGKGKV
jgi:subtilase family serine protease